LGEQKLDLEQARRTVEKYHQLNVHISKKILTVETKNKELEKRMVLLEKRNDIFDEKLAEIYREFVVSNRKKKEKEESTKK